MQRRRTRQPSYCLHKATGQAYVTLNGKEHYLGPFDTPESKDAYDSLIAQWLAGGRTLPQGPASPAEVKADPAPAPAPAGPSVKAIILAYLEHAERHYRGPDGKPTDELKNLVDALRPVRRLFGNSPAAEFGALALRAVREEMIRSGLARKTINARIHRIRRCFRWAVSVEQISPEVIQKLDTIEALAPGRSDAPETDPIEPVPLAVVEATLPHLNRVVAAMVRIQLLTGCRAGEVMSMRGRDLTPGEPNWEYRPEHHKGAWRGKKRVILLGPQAQAVVKEFLKPDLEAFLFDPRDVVAELHERRTGRRKSRPTPSEISRRCPGKPGAGRSHHYDRRTYRQAVIRGCDRAFPHPTLAGKRKLTALQRRELKGWQKERRWSPLQLRHTRGTEVRSRYGLEGAQCHLGHSKADITEVYAQRDSALAQRIAAEIG
jgi:integrase